MPAAAAEAPTGNHHVFATKKYALMKVISQMTTRRTRPMYPDLPVEYSALTDDPAAQPSESGSQSPKTGRVYHRSFEAQAGYCMSFCFPRGDGVLGTRDFFFFAQPWRNCACRKF